MLTDVVATMRKSQDCSLEARLLVDRDAVNVVRSVLPLTLIVVWPSTLRDSLINWASLSVRLALLVLRRRRVVLGAAAFTALSVLSALLVLSAPVALVVALVLALALVAVAAVVLVVLRLALRDRVPIGHLLAVGSAPSAKELPALLGGVPVIGRKIFEQVYPGLL